MLVENGIYPARPTRQSVYEKENGAVVCCMEFDLGGGKFIKNYFTVIGKDGTLNTKCIANLKDLFGWNGTDLAELANGDFTQIDVELVIENQPDKNDPTKVYSNILWVNKPGGGPGQSEMPASSDLKSLTAKYGAKFRAVAGPVTRPAARTAAPQTNAAGPRTPPRRPAAQGNVSSEADCWAKSQSLRPNETDDEQAAFFWTCISQAVGSKTEGITPQEWGKVMEVLNQELPF